jgi:ankyrin repeat protein
VHTLCVHAKKHPVLKVFLEHGVDPNVEKANGQTPLFYATEFPTMALLRGYGADLNHRDQHGRTALTCAAQGRCYRLKDLDSPFPEVRVNTATLLDLLQCQVDPNIADKRGNTPLFYATLGEAVATLLLYGADPLHLNHRGMNVLHAHACSTAPEPQSIRLLLEYGVDPALPDRRGWTPLHYAAQCGHLDIVLELLPRVHDVNCRSHQDVTPLHLAILGKARAIVEQLLKHGADPSAVDKEGTSPLELAHYSASEEIEELLLRYLPAHSAHRGLHKEPSAAPLRTGDEKRSLPTRFPFSTKV